MRKTSLVLLALLGAGPLPAQEPAELEDIPVEPRWRTSYFPYISGGTNDGPVFSFRVRHWQPAEYEARVTANAAFNADAGVTLRGSRHAYLQFRAPLVREGWRFDSKIGARREARFGYYGLGNDTGFNDDLVTPSQPFLYRVRRTRYRAHLEVTRRISGPFHIAGQGEVERARFTTLPEFSLFRSDFGTELRQTDVAGRLALIYDTRDNEYNTHQGLLFEAGAQVGSGADGYTRLYGILRGFLTVREGTVVAARIAGSGMGGTPTLNARYTIPGWEREIPVLGGEYSHRALDVGRLAGEHVLFGNLEVRHDLLPFGDLGAITLLAFVDAGRVFEGQSFRLTTDDMKVGGGGGVAIRLLRSTIFVFNFAGGPDGFNFSVGSGWMY